MYTVCVSGDENPLEHIQGRSELTRFGPAMRFTTDVNVPSHYALCLNKSFISRSICDIYQMAFLADMSYDGTYQFLLKNYMQWKSQTSCVINPMLSLVEASDRYVPVYSTFRVTECSKAGQICIGGSMSDILLLEDTLFQQGFNHPQIKVKRSHPLHNPHAPSPDLMYYPALLIVWKGDHRVLPVLWNYVHSRLIKALDAIQTHRSR